MDSMRIHDEHIDRSLWPLEPTQAAKYQFLSDMSLSSPKCRGSECSYWCHRRRERDDDERTLTSMSTRRSKTGGDALLGMVQQVCARSGKAPRRRVNKLLQKEKTEATAGGTEKTEQQQQMGRDGVRRSSEATLVESWSSKEEQTKK